MDQVADQARLTRTELRDTRVNSLTRARLEYAQRLDAQMRDAPGLPGCRECGVDVPAGEVRWRFARSRDAAGRNWCCTSEAPNGRFQRRSAAGDPRLSQFITTLTYLAAQRDARPELADRVLEYLDQGIAFQDDSSDTWEVDSSACCWRRIAWMNSPLLCAWVNADDAGMTAWEIPLGYLLAEQGRPAEAIALFEKRQANDLLAADDLQALAEWYLALNQRDKYRAGPQGHLRTHGRMGWETGWTRNGHRWSQPFAGRDATDPIPRVAEVATPCHDGRPEPGRRTPDKWTTRCCGSLHAVREVHEPELHQSAPRILRGHS